MLRRTAASIAALLGIILAGCAAKTVYERPGATASDFERDKAQCAYESQLATAGRYQGYNLSSSLSAGVSEAVEQVGLQRSCLAARGYVERRVE